ncbi:hypothetical protein B9T62_10150 [Paenibacillus donghaensis]|uniref:Uncharacterized protein n=2 Tax=Paenibacillus donghaensis TaxID=414771 RepID=A0A2Z2K523_9BACL|nr:hypothetical protein B9T62_10150 [Paenibacillus donghaensis]
MKNNMDYVLPLYGRAQLDKVKAIRSITGDYIGNIGQQSVFHQQDLFNSKKADKLDLLEIVQGQLKKRTVVKLPLPQCESLTIDADQNLQAFSRENGGLLQRQLQPDGQLLRQRVIELECDLFLVLSASFEQGTELIAVTDLQLEYVTVQPGGQINRKLLITLGTEIYSIWSAEKLEGSCYLFRFTHESGNGWAVLQGGELTSLFITTGDGVYTDRISKEVIDLGDQPVVLSDLTASVAGHYTVQLYEQAPRLETVRTIYLLTKRL